MKNSKKNLISLQLLLALYSCGGIFSKMAAGYTFLSLEFLMCYGGIILILGIYAVCWQQIIKKMPLTVAYANKAVTVVWGIIWGIVFFEEKINMGKIIGAMAVVAGIIFYVAGGDSTHE